MGLNERRKMKELQDVTLPEREKEIQEICGQLIPYKVEWDSFADSLEALNFLDNLSCHRLNMALRVICQDEMGKEAVRDGLKGITLSNVAEPQAMEMTFDAGTLTMRCAYAKGTSGMFPDGDIRQLLIAKL